MLKDKVLNLVTAAVHEALAKTFGKKILERAKNDSSYNMLKNEIDKKPGKDLSEKLVSHIIEKAPHPKYQRWLAQSYANGGINKLDDVDKTVHALHTFHKHNAKLPNKDIHSYKGFHDLSQAVEPHMDKKTKSEEKRNMSADLIKNGEATLVHDSPHTRVVIPQTEAASKHFGKNTKWCTAAEDSRNYFNDYKPQGNLFYFQNKKKNERHAIFVPHKDFKSGEYQAPEAFDEQDKAMHPSKVMEMYPDAKEHVYKHVPSIAHHSSLGKFTNMDESHPEYHSSADAIEKLVAKHIK